ncbi:MAG: hypothetical protein R3F48_13440 [Candidatus Zixiibacteriota bacterium]
MTKPFVILFAFLLGSIGLFTSGCNQETVIKAQVKEDAPEGLAHVAYTIGKNEISGYFNLDGQEVSVECAVAVIGELEGQPFSKTFYATLTAKGSAGGRYELSCTDPLLMQFPVDAANFAGTYSGSSSGNLIIDETLTSLPISNSELIIAQPGYKLVLVQFPDDIPDGTYESDISFDLDSSRPIMVKALLTGKMECDEQTIYPPMVPCVSDFSEISPNIIPVSDTLVEVRPEMAGFIDDCESLVTCGIMAFSVPSMSYIGIIILLFLIVVSVAYCNRSKPVVR